jgi:transposase InsO family protein
VVEYLCKGYDVSERRACRLTRLHRGTYRYRSHKNPWLALRMRMREIAQARVRYGYRKIRVLTIVGVFTGESLAVEVGPRLKGTHVVEVLNQIRAQRRTPGLLFCDNGSEFSSQIMDMWAYQNGVKIDFSRPGKSTDNAYIETFNGTLRAECLDTHWFGTMEEAKETIEAWRREYNESRPHRALGERTPKEFAHEIAASRDLMGLKTAENSPWSWYKKPGPIKEARNSLWKWYKKPGPSCDVNCLPSSGTKTRAPYWRATTRCNPSK